MEVQTATKKKGRLHLGADPSFCPELPVRVGLPGPASVLWCCCLRRLEREDDVEHLLPVAGLLEIGNLAASALGNPRFGDLVIGHGVGGGHVFRADDPGNLKLTSFEVDPEFLSAVNCHVAVGKDLGDHGRDAQFDIFTA